MISYYTRNTFPRITKDYLKKETYEKLEEYLHSSEFQKDLKETYWEHTGTADNHTSNLISLNGDLKNNFYKNFELEVRDDEDLDRYNLDTDKLKRHYKNLLEIIFESEEL